MTDAKLGMLINAFFGLLSFAWITAVLATCTYLVFWRGYSGWWYILAICLSEVSVTSNTKEVSK